MLTERANAKINLFLDIVSKRENGYHNLRSLMHTLSLCDLVTLDYTPAQTTKILLEASGNDSMPKDCRNLAYRAAEKLLAVAGRTGEVRIYLEKHIPMEAGLGGGSTDAAAVLRLLNRALGEPLTRDELLRVGETIGADVPFCIHGGSCLVGGIGEELIPAPGLPGCFAVVGCMGEGVSTPEAYGKLDELHGNFVFPDVREHGFSAFFEAMEAGNLPEICNRLYNIFEEVIPNRHPYVNRLKQIMRENGALGTLMSGSGPSVFGLFERAEDAAAACDALQAFGANAFLCHP